jgi:hypothetical protein
VGSERAVATPTHPARITYTRLPDGTWGVRGPVDAIVPGRVVGIGKRDGTTCHREIARVLTVRGATAVATVIRP